MFWFLLIGLGGLFVVERSSSTSNTGLPKGVTFSALQHAVAKALKTETEPQRLFHFAQAVKPYNLVFAMQLESKGAQMTVHASQFIAQSSAPVQYTQSFVANSAISR